MAMYEKCLDNQESYSPETVDMAREILTLRSMLWLNHGHKGMYGDDGEMQCWECVKECGFWDWRRTDIGEIERKMAKAGMRKVAKSDYWKGKLIEEMTKEEVAGALKESREIIMSLLR